MMRLPLIIRKMNPNHDNRGRFSSGGGGSDGEHIGRGMHHEVRTHDTGHLIGTVQPTRQGFKATFAGDHHDDHTTYHTSRARAESHLRRGGKGSTYERTAATGLFGDQKKRGVPLMILKRRSEAQLTGEIFKIDPDQRLVYGWASVIEENDDPVVDLQGDVIKVEALTTAAHDFMEERAGGVMHEDFGGHIGTVVESMVFSRELQKALGIDLKKVGWLIALKVTDDRVWKDVKDGTLKAFSIGGVGVRQSLSG